MSTYRRADQCWCGIHVQTLVFEDKGTAKPFIVLMHGDQRVDTKALAAHLGSKRGMLQPLIGAVVWRVS